MDEASLLHRGFSTRALLKAVTPFEYVHAFSEAPHLALLENPGEVSKLGRYSFLCVDPFMVFRTKGTQAFIGPPGRERPVPGNPLDVLGGLLDRYRAACPTSAWHEGLPPFLGGAVGYLGYELLHHIEEVTRLARDDYALPDGYLMFCRSVLANDLSEGRAWIMSTAFEATAATAQRVAEEAALALEQRIHATSPMSRWSREELRGRRETKRRLRPQLTEDELIRAGFTPVIGRESYLQVVEAAKQHIKDGDVFEVCTTNRFDATFDDPGLKLYEVLRGINPCPFASYLRFPELEVMGSSPERYMMLDRAGVATTRPIKGTRPRGATPEEDALLKEELARAPKDLAENLMIVDLARNDLGRVCEFGSVRVPEKAIVETYPFTHQLVSTVRGRLRRGMKAIDLLRASFPGGSMTGAPKVEAMKVINRLEPVQRGVFSGAIGYLDYEGAFDLNIVIRTLIKKGRQLTFHVGGAIVADSDPAGEYQETLDKAHALVNAFEIAREL